MMFSSGSGNNIMLVKASLINKTVTAGTNILSSSLSPTYYTCIFRIYVAFDTSGVLSVVRTSGSTTIVEYMNSGNDLEANAAYCFDIIVESGEKINLRYSVDATANVVKVVEMIGAW